MSITFKATMRQFMYSFVVCAALLLFAAAASAWTSPAQTAPGGNTVGPLTTTATAQTKTGSLTIGSGASTVVIVNGGVAANNFCLGAICINEWDTALNPIQSGTRCGSWTWGSSYMGDYHTSCAGLPRAQCPLGYGAGLFYEADGVYMYGCYKY